ncbi:MAG: hypothetical protein NVS2B12_15370 [Ktedonobacteraceae bacterium]
MQVTQENIQLYDATHDAEAIVALWQATLADTWPLDATRMEKVLRGREPQHFIARINGEVVGFAATFKSLRGQDKVGHLAALLVAPHMQRQGIGTFLHNTVLTVMKDAGVSAVQLGSTSPRFWCGIPGNLPQAVSFFRKQGWQTSDTVYDLVEDISNYTTPAGILERMEQERISIAGSTTENVTEVLAFEAREFPNWLTHYMRYADLGDYRDLLVARDHDNRVVGTLIMYAADSHPKRTDVIWQQILGETVGAIGAVGVAESARGRGIGLALVARGTELLQQRGVQNCYIDWVKITDFYAKLGYEKWREYYLSWREL